MTFEAKKNVTVRTLTGNFLKVPKINEDLPETGVNLNFLPAALRSKTRSFIL